MEEFETKGIMINGELPEIAGKSRNFRLTIIQMIVTLIFIAVLIFTKFLLPGTYEEIKNEYVSRMYDPIFAEESGEGLTKID